MSEFGNMEIPGWVSPEVGYIGGGIRVWRSPEDLGISTPDSYVLYKDRVGVVPAPPAVTSIQPPVLSQPGPPVVLTTPTGELPVPQVAEAAQFPPLALIAAIVLGLMLLKK